MKGFGQVLAVVAATAIFASPVYAGVGWDWSWTNECGGNNFTTCMSGSISYDGGNTITVFVENISPYEGDLFTAIGLFNLPSGLTPTITADDLTGWTVAPNYNGINGALPPETYAINGDNGSNNGFGEDGIMHQFTFTFTGLSQATMLAWEDVVGVGAHVQRGPNGCSARVGVNSSGIIDNFDPEEAESEGCVSVPEPGSMALLATGAFGMALIARRRRNGAEIVDEDGNDIEA